MSPPTPALIVVPGRGLVHGYMLGPTLVCQVQGPPGRGYQWLVECTPCLVGTVFSLEHLAADAARQHHQTHHAPGAVPP